MDFLVHFHNNKFLFKCDKSMFKLFIKSVLKNLVSNDPICDETLSYIFETHNSTIKCLICLQVINNFDMELITKSFLICDNCCDVCINKRLFVWFSLHKLYRSVYSRVLKYDNHLRTHFDIGELDFNDRHALINNSHKLVHRFYHVIPIMFLLSISDYNSHCNELNRDVITYIIKFIY